MDEGRRLQTLRIGSHDEERPDACQRHYGVMPVKGAFAGPHHEIYLSAARKTPPEKLKTIQRPPVRSVEGHAQWPPTTA